MKTQTGNRKQNITRTSLALCIYTTLAFHIPAFKAVIANIEGG